MREHRVDLLPLGPVCIQWSFAQTVGGLEDVFGARIDYS